MLDKSIPYKHVIMRLNRNTYFDEPSLPEGFHFRFFQKGDEYHWARIETSVLEFDNEEKALAYFSRDYLYRLPELEKRCVFVINREGLPVATATAWYANSRLGYQASLHWVGVCPEYQGKGLGKAVVKKVLSLFASWEPEERIWLHTQTWSHVAIRMYHSLGFNILKTESTAVEIGGENPGPVISKNDYEEAMQILKDIYEPEFYEKLIATAE
ncbi:MAG TPA: GNAT family N-acetyltransferase [Clostridiaceae bacterium]|nr:GNAT family N-acetyltransferase [Clostridiaceae bacterium]